MARQKPKKKAAGKPAPGKGKSCGALRILGVAILLTVVATVVHTVEAMWNMPYYMDEAYFGVWSEVMMPADGPPGDGFYMLSTLFSFITALIYIWAFHYVYSSLKGRGWVGRGLHFALLIFLVAVVPGTMATYLLINLPLPLILCWGVSGLSIAVFDGLIISRLC